MSDDIFVWVYILGFFAVAAVVCIIGILCVGFAIYLKTGVHVKNWFEKKFEED